MNYHETKTLVVFLLGLHKNIMGLQEQSKTANANCIGFEVPNTEYYDDWENDKVKNKIGFQ